MGRPAADAAQLAKVGFVAQDTPVYAGLSIADHLRFGAHTNPGWDAELAADRIAQLGLDPTQKAGKLSGGQRAQLALTLAIAKRPELLVLDEPVASLDPLARREFLRSLMSFIAEHKASVILSSHLVSDLERVCDYLVVLVASRVRLAGEVEDLLATHHRLIGPRRDPADLRPASIDVIEASHTDRQSTLIVRSSEPDQRSDSGRSNGSTWKTWCWPTCPTPPTVPGRHSDDLVHLAAVPHPVLDGRRACGRARHRARPRPARSDGRLHGERPGRLHHRLRLVGRDVHPAGGAQWGRRRCLWPELGRDVRRARHSSARSGVPR